MGKFITYLSLVLVAVLWAGATVSAKAGLRELAPVLLSILRFLVAIPILILILYTRQNERLKIINPARDLPIFLVLGLSGVTLFYVLQYNSLLYTSASIGSIVVNTNPIFIALFSALLNKERIGVKRMLGIFISFFGLCLVLTNGDFNFYVNYTTIYGAFIMLLAAICWGVYTVVGKKILREYSPLASTTITFIIGTLCFLPFLLNIELPDRLTLIGWFSIFYLGIASSVLGYLLYNRALSKLEASEAGVFLYTIPLFAILLSALFLGEVITWAILIGGVLVVYGIYLAERS